MPRWASSAGQASAAEQRRRTDWIRIGLPRNGNHLFGCLPFSDAIRLAALVGTGQATWAEIEAALDARIKLAIDRLRPGRGQRPAPADPHAAWEQARRAGEDEIWACYHARCDAVFAGEASDDEAEQRSHDQLRDKERILDCLRNERDRSLAALNRRIGSQPPRQPTTSPQKSLVMAWTELTGTERDAVRKLDASGFAGSQMMADMIHELAMRLAGTVDRSA